MRPLRVVHLVEALGTGGLEHVVASLARHARGRGFEVEVLCAVRAGRVAAEIEAADVRVRILGATGYRPRDILRAARALREIGPDIVHSHGHFAGVLGRAAAWWAGVPIAVHHMHTIDTTLHGRHRRLERLLAGVTWRVLCCSRAVAAHAGDDLGVPESLLLIVPNGIDPAPASSADTALAEIGRPAPPIVGCLGSLTPHKGQAVLLRSLEHLPPDRPLPTIVFIGDGPERSALESLAAALRRRARVLFLGERHDARSLLPAFDLLVVPSVAREGFGLAAIEAMDAGIPVVASRVGGLPEVVEDGRTGILVPPGDPAALADAVTRLLDRPETRRSLGAEGHRRVERRFRAAAMARRVEDLYEEAIHARRAA
jgi:glycosyltransferase involved in cell wall biosynthesis